MRVVVRPHTRRADQEQRTVAWIFEAITPGRVKLR
jgi:hypothetical protein